MEAAGTAPIKYEWLFNSKVLKGQHGPKLTIQGASKKMRVFIK